MEEVNWVDGMRARFMRIGGVDLPVPPGSELAADRSIFEDFGLEDFGPDESSFSTPMCCRN